MLFLLSLCSLLLFSETTDPEANLPYTPPALAPHWIEIPEDDNCDLLQPNESMLVNDSDEDSPTGIRRNYRLTRLPGNNIYRVDLNFNFEPTEDYLREFRESYFWQRTRRANEDASLRTEAQRHYTQQVQSCLDRFQSTLRSADVQFKFFVNNPRHGQEAPPRTIQLLASHENSRVDQWAADVSCGTMAHEVFHHLGFSDGYYRNADGVNYFDSPNAQGMCPHHRAAIQGESCRHLEPEGIMNQYAQYFVDQPMRAMTCERRIGAIGPGPSRTVQRVDELPSQCPQGYHNRYTSADGYSMETLNAHNERKSHIPAVMYVTPYERQTTYALRPAHVRLITQPHCVSQNRLYLTCLENSARSRSAGCLNTPSACQGDFTQ